MKTKEFLECEDCGVASENVEKTLCPYNEDVNGLEIEAILCPQCYNLRCDDI